MAFPATAGAFAVQAPQNLLKMGRGCVADQPQRVSNSSVSRKIKADCGWSKTPQTRSGIFRPALQETPSPAGRPGRPALSRKITQTQVPDEFPPSNQARSVESHLCAQKSHEMRLDILSHDPL